MKYPRNSKPMSFLYQDALGDISKRLVIPIELKLCSTEEHASYGVQWFLEALDVTTRQVALYLMARMSNIDLSTDVSQDLPELKALFYKSGMVVEAHQWFDGVQNFPFPTTTRPTLSGCMLTWIAPRPSEIRYLHDGCWVVKSDNCLEVVDNDTFSAKYRILGLNGNLGK